jgi:hypothetical protein
LVDKPLKQERQGKQRVRQARGHSPPTPKANRPGQFRQQPGDAAPDVLLRTPVGEAHGAQKPNPQQRADKGSLELILSTVDDQRENERRGQQQARPVTQSGRNAFLRADN